MTHIVYKRFLIMLSSVVAIAAALFLMPFFSSTAQAATAVAKGPYTWKDPHGVAHETAYIKIGDNIVFCIDPGKPAPYGGHSYNLPKRQYDDGVKAILYYGFGGDGNEIGNSMTDMVKTYVALNNWLDGKRTQKTYSNLDSEVWGLIKHAKKGDAPSYQVSFSKTKVSSSISGDQQKSETIKLNGKGTVSLKVPSKVTIHVKNGKTQKGGKITVHDGQSFYFTAPLDYDSDYATGNVNGEINQLASLLYMPNSNSYQRLMGSSFVIDPVVAAGFTVDFEKRQKKITVLHKDKYEGTVLKKTTETKNIGTNYSYSPEKEIKKDGKTYVPVKTEKKTGKLGNKDITITFEYALQRKITVLHKDNRDKSLIKKQVFTKKRGDAYSYGPLTNLKKNNYTYRPISTKKTTGTVGKNDITITIYYDVPLIIASFEKLQIYTAPAADGLPVKASLAKTNIYKNDTEGMTTTKINVSLYEGNTLLSKKTYTAEKLPKTVNFTIPEKSLKVNENKLYTVKLEGFNPNDIDVPEKAKQLSTKGYTSSEDAVSMSMKDVSENPGSVKRVVMTEVTPTTSMKSYFETMTYQGQLLPKRKTGYGSEQNLTFTYENMLQKDDDDIKFDFKVPEELMDTYLNYSVKDGKAIFPMDVAASKKSSTADNLIREMTFVFPHVNVEKETGSLFTDQQVKANDKRLKNAVRDGGNKFYTPIWAELGSYDVSYTSSKVGVNKVTFELKDKLTLFAYMYGHMNSKTKDQDEIMLTPINADDPFPNGAPGGWSQSDINWLKK
nr:Adhesion protein Tie [Bacillus atrophaeus]